MRGQALVPLTRLLLWDGFHEVPLQLTDAGVMLQQVLVRFIELLHTAKKGRGRAEGSGGGAGEKAPGKLTKASESRQQ